MFGNLLGSQLIAPYSAEIGTIIRYSKMFFCGCLALYCIFSKEFKKEFFQVYNHLSFLCKDREEKFKDKPYNDKDKFMSTKNDKCG